jgi:hypothetical protein
MEASSPLELSKSPVGPLTEATRYSLVIVVIFLYTTGLCNWPSIS